MVPVTLQPRRAPQRDGLVEVDPGRHLRRRTREHGGTRERLRATSWPGCAIDRPNDPASTRAWPAVCGPGWRTGPVRWSRAGGTTHRRSTSGPDCSWVSADQNSSSLSARQREDYPSQVVTSYLVHALFRQLVTTGSVGDPLTDALDALGLHPNRAGLVRHVGRLDRRARSELRAELTNQIGHLRELTPHFAPGWLPRTDDRVAIPLAGGRVVLCGVFDLLVGAPVPGQASLCALQLTSGGPWAFARTALHYLALLETLRHGNPPFRLGLLDSAVGRYVIEDVQQEHLRAMTSHLVTRLALLAGADD